MNTLISRRIHERERDRQRGIGELDEKRNRGVEEEGAPIRHNSPCNIPVVSKFTIEFPICHRYVRTCTVGI